MYVCSLCKTDINDGAVVCVGCQGTVVYGATVGELSEAFKIGFFPAAIIAVVFATWLVGFSFSVLFGSIVLGLICGIIVRSRRMASKSSVVRTFRYG